ncbi:MAG: autotransporter outer membrane beta-barrel domain-containing protein, partial [Gammaproteobacteria bacterium]|nr:autotransporter outer membrane beta-barrel domain-containing protein [Gammaproteobacteria bacterium]
KISHTVTIDDDERHNPDPTLLTGMTIHDGIRELYIKSSRSGDAVGLGGPGEIYTVQVSPGRRWLDLTLVWTNTAITSVTGSSRYYDSARSAGSTLTWNNSNTTQRLDMQSPMGGSGHPLLTLTVNGVTSGSYQVRFQHNGDWKSTHDRLAKLVMNFSP